LIIRPEKPAEFPAVYDLVKASFKTARVSNGKEQDYVNDLRTSLNYIPQLALVAEEDEKIIGHIMLTKTYVMGTQKYEAVMIAPLCVAPNHQNQGVGTALVKKSFQLAKANGYRAVFVVGDPAYYGRFGFRPTAQFGIKHFPEENPDQNLMVYQLTKNALAGISGIVTFT
jgi:predicted N-acetyltransferase YhbS